MAKKTSKKASSQLPAKKVQAPKSASVPLSNENINTAITTSSSADISSVSEEEKALFNEFYESALSQYMQAKSEHGDLVISKSSSKKCCFIKWLFKTIFKILVASCLVYAIKLYILYQVKYYSLYYLLPPVSYPLNKVKNYLITIFTIFITKVLPTNLGNSIIDKIGTTASTGFEKTVIKNAVSIDLCSANTLQLVGKLIQLQIYSFLPTPVVEFINYLISLIQLALHNLHERIIVGISDLWIDLHPQSHQYAVSHFHCFVNCFNVFTKQSCECVKKTFF